MTTSKLSEQFEALIICVPDHINMFKWQSKYDLLQNTSDKFQWSHNRPLSGNESLANLFLAFLMNDGKEHLFYEHYIIFQDIFSHLFGTVQGNTLGHNSVLEEKSDDEPSLFKASLTLICHMQSLCVRLKIVFQFCVPEHKTLSYTSSKSLERYSFPDNKCGARDMDRFQGIQLPSFSIHRLLVSWSVTKIIVHSPGFLWAGIIHTSGKKTCFNI